MPSHRQNIKNGRRAIQSGHLVCLAGVVLGICGSDQEQVLGTREGEGTSSALPFLPMHNVKALQLRLAILPPSGSCCLLQTYFYHGCCLVSDVTHISVSELLSVYKVCTNVVLILDCGVCRKAEIRLGRGTLNDYKTITQTSSSMRSCSVVSQTSSSNVGLLTASFPQPRSKGSLNRPRQI